MNRGKQSARALRRDESESDNESDQDSVHSAPKTRVLGKRSTRGKRMNELIGKALEEDDAFYNNEIWAEGEESDAESFEMNVDDRDEFDSDFNDTEDDENDEDEELKAEREVRRSEASHKRSQNKQENRYREPGSILGSFKRKRKYCNLLFTFD